jgi:hypothetical protein
MSCAIASGCAAVDRDFARPVALFFALAMTDTPRCVLLPTQREVHVLVPADAHLLRILPFTSDVHDGKTDLQRDQRIRPDMEAPDDPQRIAEQEKPETNPPAPPLGGGDVPGSRYGHKHCRPLNEIDVIHWIAPTHAI